MSEQDPSSAVKGFEGLKRKREEMVAATRAGVQRYLVTVEYMGTRFLGFQKQRDKRTVQGCLEVYSLGNFACEWVTEPKLAKLKALMAFVQYLEVK